MRIVRNFRHDHPGARVVKLEQNYRSTGNIVAGALGVIEPAEDREPKELWTANPPGDPIRVVGATSERDEAAFVVGRVKELLESGVSHGEIAIFYRIHAQSRVLEEVVRAAQIPYQIVGGVRFFERAEIKDVLSYMRLVANPSSDVDLDRIINVPPRRLGDATLAKLAAKARELGTSAFDAIEPLVRSDELSTQPKKALARFHALVCELMDFAKTAPPSEVAQQILETTGYLAMLEADESEESEGRLFNLEEFVGSIGEFESEIAAEGEVATLSQYLERVTLTAQVDDMKDAPKIVMMTVHAAKGLEFEHVFITGMEEDMFPFRSQDPNRKNDEEEERRLAYVAVTRARKELVITHAETRAIFGTTRLGTPSGFISDLPGGVVRHETTPQRRSGYGRSGVQGRFIDRDSFAPDLGRSRADAWVHPMDRARSHEEAPPSFVPGERFVVRDEDEHATRPSAPRPPARGRTTDVRVGARVRHNQFGVGVVEEIEPGQDPTATVRFPGWSSKRIKARFLAFAE
ncbi:MAG: 3'-5' exonuclease [Polyangiaceae bacterium]